MSRAEFCSCFSVVQVTNRPSSFNGSAWFTHRCEVGVQPPPPSRWNPDLHRQPPDVPKIFSSSNMSYILRKRLDIPCHFCTFPKTSHTGLVKTFNRLLVLLQVFVSSSTIYPISLMHSQKQTSCFSQTQAAFPEQPILRVHFSPTNGI